MPYLLLNDLHLSFQKLLERLSPLLKSALLFSLSFPKKATREPISLIKSHLFSFPSLHVCITFYDKGCLPIFPLSFQSARVYSYLRHVDCLPLFQLPFQSACYGVCLPFCALFIICVSGLLYKAWTVCLSVNSSFSLLVCIPFHCMPVLKGLSSEMKGVLCSIHISKALFKSNHHRGKKSFLITGPVHNLNLKISALYQVGTYVISKNMLYFKLWCFSVPTPLSL